MIYRVKNWQRYQHYKDRRPPCIKIHCKILSSRKFMSLAAGSKCLLMLLWVIVSESRSGEIDGDLDDIRWRLHWPDLQETDFLF